MSALDRGRPLGDAMAALLAGLEDEDRLTEIDGEQIVTLLATVVRAYVAKLESGQTLPTLPTPSESGGPTATEALVVVGDLLDAADVELFELAMWQAMGNVRAAS